MASGFEVGDIVWGKVESHPWWPGQISDEALASLSVRQKKSKGCLFVSFFGDNTYNWLCPKNLLPFECHFSSKSNQSKSKAFQEAVQEAINEVNLREELAFNCLCRNPSIGYEEGADYPVGQVEKSRRDFKPAEMVSFLHKAALGPMNLPRDGHSIRSAARILAYRKIVFAEKDPTYDEAFDSADEDPKWASNDHRNALAQGAASTNFSERGAFTELKGKRKGASSGHSQPIKACGESKRAKVEKAVEGPKVSIRRCGKASVFKNRYKCPQRNEGEAEIVDKEALISKPFKPSSKSVPLEKALAKNVGEPPLENSSNEKELASLASPKCAEADLLDPKMVTCYLQGSEITPSPKSPESPKLIGKAYTEVPQKGSSSSVEGAGRSEGGGNALLSTVVNQWDARIVNYQRTIPPSVPPPPPPVPVYRYVYSRQTLSRRGNAMNKKHLESCQTAATTAASSTADIARPILKLLKEIDKHLEDLK